MEYRVEQRMDLTQKLEILADAAKYDVACTSSGVERNRSGKGIGNCIMPGTATASVRTADAFPF